MEIYSWNKKLILRSFIKADIADYLRWFTTETDWMDYDAPWEKEISSIEEEQAYWESYYHKTLNRNQDIPQRLEITLNNEEKTHIGWVIYYYINEQYQYIEYQGRYTIGIDIPDQRYRGQGYGYLALKTYISFLKDKEIKTIYLQTWSGNKVMTALSTKLGFVVCNRIKNHRFVNGVFYDALTYYLDI